MTVKSFLLALAALAACKHTLTPEEQRTIDGWVQGYLAADARSRESEQGSPEFVRARRERDMNEMKLADSLQESGWAPGVQKSISRRGEELGGREEQLAQERNGILVQGRALSARDDQRLEAIETERKRVASMKESLSQLAARLLPKMPENSPKPSPIPKNLKY